MNLTEETEIDWNEIRQHLREGRLFFPRMRIAILSTPDGPDWMWNLTEMTPEEIALALTSACPTCAEQPGDPCRIWPDRTVLAEPHPMRYDSAQFVQAVERHDNQAQTNQVTEAEIEATGLV